METHEPTAEYRFESHFLEVLGSSMHYVDVGSGNPILFLHGNPTWSYVWRNIIPYVTDLGRVIAPDLMGMGRSGKPDIPYRFFDHANYLQSFIDKLGLEKITLVLHDWGSVLGFDYACRNPERIAAIAFMEANVRPRYRWEEFDEESRRAFGELRDPQRGYQLSVVENTLIEKMLPGAIYRRLSAKEMEFYREPFLDPSSRRPLMQWPRELPIAGEPEDVFAAVEAYSSWLKVTQIPKLLLFSEPGAIIGQELVEWCQQNFPHLEARYVGRGIHFIQEDCPTEIGTELRKWYGGLRRVPL